MLRHLVQRLALEISAFLFGRGIGIVGGPLPVLGDFPTEGGLYAAHIGFINVSAVTDKVVRRIADHALCVAITAVTATDFGDLVFEVGVEQGYAGVQALLVIPHHADLFAQALLWLQIRIADDD
ncbi:hypothetical protein D3C79_896840 [compost metagenome]